MFTALNYGSNATYYVLCRRLRSVATHTPTTGFPTFIHHLSPDCVYVPQTYFEICCDYGHPLQLYVQNCNGFSCFALLTQRIILFYPFQNSPAIYIFLSIICAQRVTRNVQNRLMDDKQNISNTNNLHLSWISKNCY